MKEQVFEGILLDLPVDSTNITVRIEIRYKTGHLDIATVATRKYPSKAEATFKRESRKIEDTIKKVGKDAEQAMSHAIGLEERLHKRITKLEKRNDPDAARVT